MALEQARIWACQDDVDEREAVGVKPPGQADVRKASTSSCTLLASSEIIGYASHVFSHSGPSFG